MMTEKLLQEAHECIGASIEALTSNEPVSDELLNDLARARELVGNVLSDTMAINLHKAEQVSTPLWRHGRNHM